MTPMGLSSWTSWQVARSALARLGKWLFEPSRQLVDIAARRRARLLAMLLLPNTLHLAASAIAMHLTETGVMGETMPLILGAHVPFMCGAYALSRTRYARQSGWLYIVTMLAVPVSVLFGVGPTGAAARGRRWGGLRGWKEKAGGLAGVMGELLE